MTWTGTGKYRVTRGGLSSWWVTRGGSKPVADGASVNAEYESILSLCESSRALVESMDFVYARLGKKSRDSGMPPNVRMAYDRACAVLAAHDRLEGMSQTDFVREWNASTAPLLSDIDVEAVEAEMNAAWDAAPAWRRRRLVVADRKRRSRSLRGR